MSKKIIHKTFITEIKGFVKELRTDIHITSAVNNPQIADNNKYKAIWDTGSTNTVISQKVVKDCDLIEVGFITTIGYDGEEKEVPTYYVNVYLVSP